MNNQQKYLGIGAALALAIVMLIQSFISPGSALRVILPAGIYLGAAYLVFNIYRTTRKLVPARQHRVVQKNKKP